MIMFLKKKHCIVFGFLFCIFCFSLFVQPLQALETVKTKLEIELAVDAKYPDLLPEDTYEFVLEKESGGTYKIVQMVSVVATKEGKASIDNILIENAGEYHYRLYQKAGSNQDMSYDPTVYDITVYAFYNASQELVCDAVAYKEGDTQKVSNFAFTNQLNHQNVVDVSEKKDKTDTSTRTNEQMYAMLCTSMIVLMVVLYRRSRRETNGS